MVDAAEVLVEGATGKGIPVIQPPPPAGPIDDGTDVKVQKSFNSTIKANGKNIVALGICIQGTLPNGTWPGMILESTVNKTVTINQVRINVVGDTAITLPNGGIVNFKASGQAVEV